jgi:hypothetical protein
LLQDQLLHTVLDTLPGSLQAYAWHLPADMQAGQNFSVRISSVSDAGIYGLSEGVFAIVDSTTDVEEEGQMFSAGSSLGQNSPNPFNTVTRISYTIHKSDRVSLKIYDLSGKEVHTLVNEFQNPGSYAINFNAVGLSAGIYFYELRVGSAFVESRKMLLY